MARLAGKVALVTGAARGTGEAVARLFAGEGARVVLADLRDEDGERVAREIGACRELPAPRRHVPDRLGARGRSRPSAVTAPSTCS